MIFGPIAQNHQALPQIAQQGRGAASEPRVDPVGGHVIERQQHEAALVGPRVRQDQGPVPQGAVAFDQVEVKMEPENPPLEASRRC